MKHAKQCTKHCQVGKQIFSGIRKYEDLPENARKYVERIAEVTGVPLGIVSVGPNRSQTIDLVNVF